MKNYKKLTACALAAVLGLSCAAYPVYAEEPPTQDNQQAESNELLELDETAVPMGENTETEPSQEESSQETEPETSIDEPDGNKADTETELLQQPEPSQESEPFTDGTDANEADTETTDVPPQEDNAIQPYAENNAGDFTVTGDVSGWNYDSNAKTLTFTGSGDYTVTGSGEATGNESISVAENFQGKIILNNVVGWSLYHQM